MLRRLTHQAELCGLRLSSSLPDSSGAWIATTGYPEAEHRQLPEGKLSFLLVPDLIEVLNGQGQFCWSSDLCRLRLHLERGSIAHFLEDVATDGASTV